MNSPIVPPTEDIILQAIRIGDVGITSIPCEVFVEIGLAIKDASPLDSTFTIELANGWNRYLPTPRQHRLGGYETWMGTNMLEIHASEKIERVVLDLLGEVARDKPKASAKVRVSQGCQAFPLDRLHAARSRR